MRSAGDERGHQIGEAAATLDKVRPFFDTAAAPPPPSEIDVLRGELDKARREIGNQASDIMRLEAERDAAYDAGLASGRAAGLKAGAERRAESLALLEAGVDKAIALYAI